MNDALAKALADARHTQDDLRACLNGCRMAEGIILLDLIAQAANLANKVGELAAAVSLDRKGETESV